jgi:hypothetical protein
MGLFNAISQAVQLQRTAEEHILTGVPQASAAKALFRLGNAIVGGSANGQVIGVNAATGYTGYLFLGQVNGATKAIIDANGFLTLGGATPNAGRAIYTRVDGNASFFWRHENINDGNAAGALALVACGTTNVASGSLAAFSPAHANAGLAGRFGFQTTTTNQTTGLLFAADAAAQNMTFFVGGLGEQMRFSASGELLIGTTTSLGRLAVVGRADQIQLVVRANGAQSTSLQQWQSSAGPVQAHMSGTGQLSLGSSNTAGQCLITGNANQNVLTIRPFTTFTNNYIDVQNNAGGLSFLKFNSSNVFTVHNTAGTAQFTFAPATSCGMFIANQSGQALTVSGLATTVKLMCARGLASHTGNLFEAQLNAVVGSGDFQLWSITSAGDMHFNRTSSTTSGRQVGSMVGTFAVNTDASREGRIQIFATDFNGDREVLRGEGSGSAGRLGFLGAAAIARPASYTLAGSATRTFPAVAGIYTGIDNAQGGTVYATVADLNTLAGKHDSLEGLVRQVVVDLASTSGYGLLVAA